MRAEAVCGTGTFAKQADCAVAIVPGSGSARALSDLGHRLLLTAAADVEAVTREPTRLTW
jgi:hypothetical protein